MVDAGIMDGNERLELIGGKLYPVTPSGWDHAWVVEELSPQGPALRCRGNPGVLDCAIPREGPHRDGGWEQVTTFDEAGERATPAHDARIAARDLVPPPAP